MRNLKCDWSQVRSARHSKAILTIVAAAAPSASWLHDRAGEGGEISTIPRYGNLVNAGVMTGTFERNGLRLGGLWWNYRLHSVGVASMQELIQG